MPQQFTSGEWSGFYLESHRPNRGWMHLFLSFDDGVIKGEGTDYVGPWVAQGSYIESDGHCSWIKQYIGKHNVRYAGVCGENGIQGQWQISSASGPFHIWPRNMSQFNELYLRDELAGSGTSVPSILLETISSDDLI